MNGADYREGMAAHKNGPDLSLIRAHLAALGHPLIGDAKYGKPEINRLFSRKFGLKYQLLHAYRLEFPELSDALAEVSGRSFTAPLPAVFSEILQSRQNG